MKRKIKHCFIMLVFVLVFTAMISTTAFAAAKKLNKKSVVMNLGSTYTLKLQNNNKKVKWTSSNKKIAIVNAKGKVTAKKSGTATITAKAGNKKFNCKITVRTPKLSKTSLSLTEGKTAVLTLKNFTGKVAWSSDKKSIAVISGSGKITAKKAGKAIITAKAGGKKFICKVTVKEKHKHNLETTYFPIGGSINTPTQWTQTDKCKSAGCYYQTTKPYVWKTPKKTVSQVRSAMLALQSKYPEGSDWDNDRCYTSIVVPSAVNINNGCWGFALMLQDAAFGNHPWRMHEDSSKIKIGDIVRINGVLESSIGTMVAPYHYIIITDINGDKITFANGNQNSSVGWNVVVKKQDLLAITTEIVTRW